MDIKIIEAEKGNIAVVSGKTTVFDAQSALDFFMSLYYQTDCLNIAVYKEILTEDFFDLRTKIAGDVLQKVINYHFKLAIIGDFSVYKSKALRDFIFESNRGKDIFFVMDEDEAVKSFSK